MFKFFAKIKARREIQTLRVEFEQTQRQLNNTRFECTEVRQRIKRAESDLEKDDLSDGEREFNNVLITALTDFSLESEKKMDTLGRKVLTLRVLLSFAEDTLAVLTRA